MEAKSPGNGAPGPFQSLPNRKDTMRFERGTKVYYTGDMANQSGHGEIESLRGDQVEIRLYEQPSDFGAEYGLEERRFFVPRAAFSPSPGQRFYFREEWMRQRAERIASMTGQSLEDVLAQMEAAQ
jgi:hypothetical protein